MTDSLTIATGKGTWATGAETQGVMRYYYSSATANRTKPLVQALDGTAQWWSTDATVPPT